MQAEIISIGDELTSGQRLDTNSKWLSQRLAEIGVAVRFHTTAGDALEDLCQAVRIAARRCAIVLCTGGLGPTADDLTRQALAEVANVPLQLDQQVLEHIQARFARRGRTMPASNAIQAHFPAGSRVIANPHGTAPGIDLQLTMQGAPPARVFALPGVPAEMFEMWSDTVAPALLALRSGQAKVILHRQIHCFGAGESELEQMLPDLIRRGRSPSVGITVSQATITLRIRAEGQDAASCEQQIAPVAQTIRQCLGDLVFGEGEDQLQDVVLRLLGERRLTLATIDCGSGGLLAQWLSHAAGDVAPLRAGLTLGDASALQAALPRLPHPLAGSAGGAELAQALAVATREQFHADCGLAVLDPSQLGLDADAACVALATSAGLSRQRVLPAGHPEIHRARLAKHALNLLRLQLGKST